MSRAYFTLPLLLFCAVPQALAQACPSTHTISRAARVFSGADGGKDGRIDSTEATAIPVEGNEFHSSDLDKDGFWSRDEFLLFYRQKLTASGQRVEADLEAETVRIHALRRARQDAQARQIAESAGTTVQAGKAATPQAPILNRGPSQRIRVRQGAEPRGLDASEVGLATTLDGLERRVAAGQATRADFEKTRNALRVLQDRGADGPSPEGASDDTLRKMMQSLERMEKDAGAGVYSREQYADLRTAIIRRARNMEVASGPDPDPAAAAAVAGEVLSRLENALSHLENRAASGGVNHEDFERVRAEWSTLASLTSQAGVDAPSRVADPTSETHRKLLRALGRLEERARERPFAREDYRALRELMIHRARAIIAVAPVHPSVTTSIERSSAAPAALSSARSLPEESEAVLIRLFDDLERRAASGRAVREDFQRVRDRVNVPAGVGAGSEAAGDVSSVPAEIDRRLQAALDRIEQRAAKGVYSREDYEALRVQLVRRARSAKAVEQGEDTGEGPRRTSNDPPIRAEPKPLRQGAASSDHGLAEEAPPGSQGELPTDPSAGERRVSKPESAARPRS